jgi:hypothetical protein
VRPRLPSTRPAERGGWSLYILDDRIGAQGPRALSKDEDGTTAKRPPPSQTGWADFPHPAFQPAVLDRLSGRPGHVARAQCITELFRNSWTMSRIVPFFPCECRGHQAGRDSPTLREGRRPFAFCFQREPGPDGSLRLGASAPWRQTSLPPRRSSLPPSLAIRHRLIQGYSGSFRVIQGHSSQINPKKTFRPAPPLHPAPSRPPTCPPWLTDRRRKPWRRSVRLSPFAFNPAGFAPIHAPSTRHPVHQSHSPRPFASLRLSPFAFNPPSPPCGPPPRRR